MIVIGEDTNAQSILTMYDEVARGSTAVVRGQLVKNCRNLGVLLDPSQPVLTSFVGRNFNLNYAKREWLWYLGADKFDTSIERHATMWAKLRQPDGSYYSNYGQYLFTENEQGYTQFDYVLTTLQRDINSRRASMVLLNREHLFYENTDVVCTYAINFCIEDARLHMTVMMRSNDVIFGFTNDAFCFWQLYVFMYTALSTRMPGLLMGTYTHFTNSMHVYERHFGMIANIVQAGLAGYVRMEVPTPSYDEVCAIVASKGKDLSGEYGTWLST